MNKKDLEKLKRICDSIRKDGVRAKDVKVKQIARGIGWEIYYHDGRYYVDYFNGKPIGGHKTLQGAKEELYYAGKIPSKTAELKGDYTKDAEAVIYQVTTSQDKMGRLHTEYFGSAEEVLRKHKGRIDPSSGHPRLDGFVGPFSNGTKNGKKVLLYEDKNTYLSMDSKAKAELG